MAEAPDRAHYKWYGEQVAKNCRTSVEMIEKHYAADLKDMIDTSLVNVRKSRSRGNGEAGKKNERG